MIDNLVFYLLLAYILLAAYHRFRPNPYTANIDLESFRLPADRIKFIYDLFWFEGREMKADNNILKNILSSIERAKNYILIDVFLFNKKESSRENHLPITDMVTEALEMKSLPRLFVTDPVNTTYFSEESQSIRKLQDIGVKVVFTDLEKLPDNNVIYSAFWRLFISWFGTKGLKTIPNPLDPRRKTTIRALFQALNARANHRKLILADNVSIVASGNLHNSSSFFSNTGVLIESSAVAKKFFDIEKKIFEVVGQAKLLEDLSTASQADDVDGHAEATPLVGEYIKKTIIDDLESTEKGDRITIGMLFISDRKIINILKRKAKKEGVQIDLILDRNKVSFNNDKIGFPNRFIAPELNDSGINVLWYKNDYDEFHSKFINIEKKDKIIFNTGSTNLTRRSLLGTNLEDNIRIEMPKQEKFSQDVLNYCLKLKSPKHSLPAEQRPRFYFFGHLWTRLVEKTGLAAW